MSREQKPQIYFLIRRGWYDQLNRFCVDMIAKKGKDPVAVFWKAFASGMSGDVSECLRQLESFQSRRDMLLPVTLALLYFHQRMPSVDHEVIESLNAELSVAEDVTVSQFISSFRSITFLSMIMSNFSETQFLPTPTNPFR